MNSSELARRVVECLSDGYDDEEKCFLWNVTE